MRWSFVALAFVLVGCTRPTFVSSLPTDSCKTQWCATAKVDQGGTIDVALVVPPTAARDGAKTIHLSFVEGILGRGFTNEHVRLVDSDGDEAPWPGLFDVRDRPQTIRYRVRMPDDPSLPLWRTRELSFAHHAGWHLKGYSFLPDVVKKSETPPPALLRFVLEEGERALGSVVYTEHTFHGRGLSDLVRATYEVGVPHHFCHRDDDRTVCVASSTPVSLDRTTRFVDDAIRETTTLLGPLEDTSVLVSVHPAAAEVPLGLAVGSGVVVLTNEPPSHTSQASFAIAHEIVHLWNPGKRRVPALWLREGLTEYLAHQVVSRMNGTTKQDFMMRVTEAHHRHAAVGGALEHASGEDVYAAGVMAGFCLDRLLEPSGGSTAELVKNLLAQVPPSDDVPLTDEWFFAELAKTSASSAGYFKLLMTSPEFDSSRCMTEPM